MLDNLLIKEHEVQLNLLRGMSSADCVPHALLFCGAEGIGKRMVAEVYARSVICRAGTLPACGVCESCRMLASQRSNLLLSLSPEGEKRKSIKIAQIRELQEKIYSTGDDVQICIIDQPELMTIEAGNAFLKVLEEPPEGVFFILVTAHKERLLPTILSRVMIIRFNVLSKKAIRDILSKVFIEHNRVELALNFSKGTIGRAKQFLEDCDNGHRKACEELLLLLTDEQTCYATIGECVLEWCEQCKNGGQEVIKRRLTYLAYFFRDMLLLKTRADIELLCNADVQDFMSNILRGWTKVSLHRACERCLSAAAGLNSSVNMSMFFYKLFWEIINIYRGRIFCKK